MSANAKVEPRSERSTILLGIASNCDDLKELGDRLAKLEGHLYHPEPMATAKPEPTNADNVESFIDMQNTLIHQHIDRVTRILNRLV